MRPVTVSQTGVGSSNIINLNYHLTPFNVGLGVTVSGTITYQVEASFKDVTAAGYTAAGDTWFPHATLVGQNTQQTGNYAYPVTAIRLTTTAGTGTATLTAIQAGVSQ